MAVMQQQHWVLWRRRHAHHSPAPVSSKDSGNEAAAALGWAVSEQSVCNQSVRQQASACRPSRRRHCHEANLATRRASSSSSLTVSVGAYAPGPGLWTDCAITCAMNELSFFSGQKRGVPRRGGRTASY